MISTRLSQVTAIALLIGGLALLFVPDVILPRLVPGYPREGLWLGQLLAAAWLGLASLDWLSRSALLGGIYGRPVVAANLAVFFVGALALLRAASRDSTSPTSWMLLVPHLAFAGIYGWLLLRGPFESDFRAHRAAID